MLVTFPTLIRTSVSIISFQISVIIIIIIISLIVSVFLDACVTVLYILLRPSGNVTMKKCGVWIGYWIYWTLAILDYISQSNSYFSHPTLHFARTESFQSAVPSPVLWYWFPMVGVPLPEFLNCPFPTATAAH
jgi:hypothetical protein